MALQLEMVPVLVAAFGGLATASFFAGAALDRRSFPAMATTTPLCGAVVSLNLPWIQFSATWIAASIALNAGLGLTRGGTQRMLCWAVGPLLVCAAAAAHATFVPAKPALVGSAVIGTIAIAGCAGWMWRRHLRRCAWFDDLLLLALLTAVALMAAPVLLLGWQRAAIAAEGQDPVTRVAPPLWPLIVCALAFLFGVGWRTWMNSRGNHR